MKSRASCTRSLSAFHCGHELQGSPWYGAGLECPCGAAVHAGTWPRSLPALSSLPFFCSTSFLISCSKVGISTGSSLQGIVHPDLDGSADLVGASIKRPLFSRA